MLKGFDVVLKDLHIMGKTPVMNNMLYLFATQFVNYVFPFITMKYLIFHIGVSNFGKISFAQSFIFYFIVIVDYGFNITATRNVAMAKERNDGSVSEILTNTLMAKFILLLVSSVIYCALVFSIVRFHGDSLVYLCFWGVVVGSCLFPQWYFQGIQQMGYITVINTCVKILLLLSVFIVVSKVSDYIYVPVIYSVSYILPGLYAIYLVRKELNIRTVHTSTLKETFKDGFSIFVSSAISTVLNGSTIFIMGLIVTEDTLGYYAGYDKLIKACLMLFSPITTAIYPHVSGIISTNRQQGIRYIRKAGLYTLIFVVFVALMLNICSGLIVPILFSESFLHYRALLLILSLWMIFGVLNNFIGVQYLTSTGHSKLYATLMSIASIFTVVAIVVLTYQWSCYGTALSVLIGESFLTVLLITSIKIKKI
jgi:polysaccharide transporter, PST family